jgi:hypothetical protein
MTDTALVEIGPLQQALALAAEAGDVEALRDVQAMATALQKGARARGLGVSAENQAAEVVLRSERALGAVFNAIPTEGRRGDSRPESPTPMQQAWALLGETRGSGKNKSGPPTRVHHWKALARIPDAEFEAMLDAARRSKERIAKVNFYESHAKRTDRPTPPHPGFEMFRAGAYNLLGWHVDDDGVGAATKNGLMELPDDELRQLRVLVEAIAQAYGEAVRARRG